MPAAFPRPGPADLPLRTATPHGQPVHPTPPLHILRPFRPVRRAATANGSPPAASFPASCAFAVPPRAAHACAAAGRPCCACRPCCAFWPCCALPCGPAWPAWLTRVPLRAGRAAPAAAAAPCRAGLHGPQSRPQWRRPSPRRSSPPRPLSPQRRTCTQHHAKARRAQRPKHGLACGRGSQAGAGPRRMHSREGARVHRPGCLTGRAPRVPASPRPRG
jgi:hypothetical protein